MCVPSARGRRRSIVAQDLNPKRLSSLMAIQFVRKLSKIEMPQEGLENGLLSEDDTFHLLIDFSEKH
jgi:hypothetical protein